MDSSEQTLIWAIRFTERARGEVLAAEDYIFATAGAGAAVEWSSGLLIEAGKLAQYPTLWPVAEEDSLFKQTVRRLLYRPSRRSQTYRVLFVLRQSPEDAPTAAIIHLRNSAQATMTASEARGIEEAE